MTSNKSSSDWNPVLGIDIGTTLVSAGVYRHGKFEQIPNHYGNYLTPNCVSFSNGIGRMIGEDSKENETINPRNTFYGIKSLIGITVPSVTPTFAYRTKSKKGGRFPNLLCEVESEKEMQSPEVLVEGVELLSIVLESIKQAAEEYLGIRVNKAVITVPAYFRYFQRQLVVEAGTLAGFYVSNILSEPEAAALAYSFRNPLVEGQKKKLMIVDIGGGGISTSVVSMIADLVEVRATAGVAGCGGNEMVQLLMNNFENEFKKTHNKNLRKDVRSLAVLRASCERAIIKLSNPSEDVVSIDQLYEGIYSDGLISQAKFGMIINDLVRGNLDPIRKCLDKASLDKKEIDNIIVTGKCGRILKVRKRLIDFFKGQEVTFEEDLTVNGAALFCEIPRGIVFLPVTPFALGIKVQASMKSNPGDIIIFIQSCTTIPTKHTRTLQMPVEKDGSKSISVEIFEEDPEMTRQFFLGKAKLRHFKVESNEYGENTVELTVTFEVSINNELKVVVSQEQTEKSVILNISEEIARLRETDAKIAEVRNTNTKKFRKKMLQIERVLARDQLEAICNVVSMKIKDEEGSWKERLSQEVRKEILDMCAQVKMWLDENEFDEKHVVEKKLEEVKVFFMERNAAFLLEI